MVMTLSLCLFPLFYLSQNLSVERAPLKCTDKVSEDV